MTHKPVIYILFVFLFALTGCGGKEAKFIGQWQNLSNTSDRMEFMRDGKAIYEYQGMGAEGTWEVLDDGRLRMKAQIFGMMSVETSTVEWQGTEKMTLTDSNGKVDVYKRL